MSDRKTPATFATPGAPPHDGTAPFDDLRSRDSKSVADPIEGVDLSGIFNKEIHINNIGNIGDRIPDPEPPNDAPDSNGEARREALLLKEIRAAKEEARREIEAEAEKLFQEKFAKMMEDATAKAVQAAMSAGAIPV
jgi:hypothetical protein